MFDLCIIFEFFYIILYDGFIFQALNQALESCNIPVEIVDGFVGSISVTIPWKALMSDSTTLEIKNLEITLQPKQRQDNAGKVMSIMT